MILPSACYKPRQIPSTWQRCSRCQLYTPCLTVQCGVCVHCLFWWEWERKMGSNPESQGVSGSLLTGRSPAVQSLHSDCCQPIVVTLGSTRDALLPQQLPLLLVYLDTPRGCSSFLWALSTVASSNSIQSSIFKAKAIVTSSPATRSSEAVTECSAMVTPLSSCLFRRVSSVSEPVGCPNEGSHYSDNTISGFRAVKHWNPRTRSQAVYSTTSTSHASTGARCFT